MGLCGLDLLAENKDQQPLASQENVCLMELLSYATSYYFLLLIKLSIHIQVITN
jgi:hypothetical protein